MMKYSYFLLILFYAVLYAPANAQQVLVENMPAELNIRKAGDNSIRITIKPVSYKKDFPYSPALDDRKYPLPVIRLQSVTKPVKKQVGNLKVELRPDPLSIIVSNARNELVQRIVLEKEGTLSFKLGNAPVLGMGEGGPKPVPGKRWRDEKVQFDRRASYDSMQPRWQADMYGSRNPVPMLIGTEGWAIFVAAPWVHVDLRSDSTGYLIPRKPTGKETTPQNEKNQQLDQGKGLPPADQTVPGLFDLFVFDAHDPEQLMKDISFISGQAVLPPKWALGYMQSHRLLQDETQMIGIVDTFRAKQIPVDAVIYLGTGFTPRGWNKQQPSFEFNPEVFKRPLQDFFSDMHKRNVKVVLHMVPWDRDKLPTLQGSIPLLPNEPDNASHILNYWQQHVSLVKTGTDGWWPDEGDWFNLFERIKRHQLYYQGPLSTQGNLRPWSLHRNGFLGISKWGGWVWSGDTESSWKTLEAQISVGINHSLSLSPFWGSDIGGFYANEELTGELYARWFQFAAFNPSFRSHGRTWWTRLPWGWGLSDMGPKESRNNPLPSEMNNKTIEPVVKKYDELHYQLLPYTYTLAWEARNTGMPLIRALWLHYPNDTLARKTGDEFLWGRDLLIAPVYEKAATQRKLYLPKGEWYDWWTNTKHQGAKTITRTVDLATMPIYVRAGAIIPLDPVRQFTSEAIKAPTTLRIYTGSNGSFTLYEDDGISQDYLKNKFRLTAIRWEDDSRKLSIKPQPSNGVLKTDQERVFRVELIPQGIVKEIIYSGKPVEMIF
jgi:alpha-glucosidase (family GH31 glycosyl hydrolase)